MPLEPGDEARRILAISSGDLGRALGLLEGQLNTLHARAQVLLSLAGVVVTVTGFSGRIVAGTNRFAQGAILLGVGFVLASAVWLYLRVTVIRWVTAEDATEDDELLVRILERRNRKTRAYRLGGKLLLVGFTLYLAAIATMLLNPERGGLPPRHRVWEIERHYDETPETRIPRETP